MDEKLNKDNLHVKKTFLILVANDQVKRVFKVPKEITQRILFFCLVGIWTLDFSTSCLLALVAISNQYPN